MRCLVQDYEDVGNFEGALESLRTSALFVDALGRSMGESSALRGSLRNHALKLRNTAAAAERAIAKDIAYEILSCTGIHVSWKDIREHGWRSAYAAAREGRSHEEADEDWYKD